MLMSQSLKLLVTSVADKTKCMFMSCYQNSGQKHHVKIKLSLCLTKHHSMKKYGGVEVYLVALFALALDEDEWSASCSSHFTLGEESPVPTG
jgi:hypothetical protein